MADIAGMNGNRAFAFMIAGGLMLEAIAAYCSSPQTTEINAKKRSDTLMKWVWLGMAQGAVLVFIAAMLSPKEKTAIIAGGAVTGGLMLASYAHARNAGLKSNDEGTENYG